MDIPSDTIDETWELLDFCDDNIIVSEKESVSVIKPTEEDVEKIKKKELQRLKKNQRDKERRLKRKKEHEQLREKIKKMREEQLLFIKKIEDLHGEAKSYQSNFLRDEINPQVTENKMLRQEVEEHREFVRRIHEMMVQTKTTAEDLQQQQYRMNQLQIKRRCTDMCERALLQTISIVKDYQTQIANGLPAGCTLQPTQAVNGGDSLQFYAELFPTGTMLKDATRVNYFVDLEFPTDIVTFYQYFTQKVKRVATSTEKEFIKLYEDASFCNNVACEEPSLSVTFHKHTLENGTEEKRIQAQMFKTINLPECSIRSDGREGYDMKCIVRITTNVASVFKDAIHATQNFDVNVHFFCQTAENKTRKIIYDTTPVTDYLLQVLDQTPDGSFCGELAERNIERMKLMYSELDDFLLENHDELMLRLHD